MRFLFKTYLLDTNLRELRCGPDRVELEPQVFDLLEFLIRNRNRVASRDDVLAAVWKGRIVSESTLSSRINAARTAIGDDGTAQQLIRTLPRKGFRFIGEIVEETIQTKMAGEQPALNSPLGPTNEGPTIAVLPFTNLSGDTDSDYFADGMTEEIIAALSHCPALQVIARSSSFTYKGRAVDVRSVGRELRAGYVLEGSVRRNQDRLRITAQLVETTSGTHLWADRFDGNMSGLFELQEQIAESAAAVVEPKVRFAESERVRRRPPQNLDAYDLWLRSVSLASEFNASSMATALEHLQRAINIDPTYAVALATASYYHAQSILQGWTKQPEVTRAEGLKLAWQAIDLGNDDANVQWMCAFAIWIHSVDPQPARELFQRSLRANPNSALALTMAGWVEAVNGNPSEGRKMVEKSLRLNPLHPHGWLMSFGMALNEIADKRFEEAASWAEKALVQNRHSLLVLRARIVALVHSGKIDRAKLVLRDLLSIDPRCTISNWRASVALIDEGFIKTYVTALRQAGMPE